MSSDCGIYIILNKSNGRRYIGQSVRINYRLQTHLSRLRNNKHYNKHLQRAWNKYGENNFIFSPVLICDQDLLTMYEQNFVDHYYPDVYNNGKFVHSPWRGEQHSDITKRRMKEAQNKPEQKALMKRRSLKNWQDESYRVKVSKGLKKAFTSPEARRQRSEIIKNRWRDNDYRKKMIGHIKQGWANLSQEERDRRLTPMRVAEKDKSFFQSKEYREYKSRNMKEVWSDDQYKKKASDAMKRAYKNGKYQNRSEVVKAWASTPQAKERTRQVSKKRWERDGFFYHLNGEYYSTLAEAGKSVGVSGSTIANWVKKGTVKKISRSC